MEIKDSIKTSKEEVIKVEESVEKTISPIIKFVKAKSIWFTYLLLTIIIGFSTYIRTRNLHLLKDVTTGKYIPLALDPFIFLRYGKDIVENGSLMIHDSFTYFPIGSTPSLVLNGITYTNIFIHKVLSVFNSTISFEFVHVIYPVIFFVLSMVVFFLLVRRLFNSPVALIATAFLSVIPTFLYRTTAGFADKEALGIFLLFLAFYLFVKSWDSKTFKSSFIYGGLSGVSTAFLALTWGGFKFVFIIFGLFAFIEWFLNRLKNSDIVSYFSWIFFSFAIPIFTAIYSLSGFLKSISTGIAFFTFIIILFDLLFSKLKFIELISKKINVSKNLTILGVSIVILFVLSSFIFGPTMMFDQISQIINGMLHTMQGSRIAVTVAEQNQPFVTQWFSNFGLLFFWMFLIGSVFLFYDMLKPTKLKRKKLTGYYLLFIILFIFSRYSPNSLLNGENFISKILYLGSISLFLLFLFFGYLKEYRDNQESVNSLLKIEKSSIFVFIWFFIMIVAARSAIRLLFVFSPIICILAAYFIYRIYLISRKLESNYKYLTVFGIILLFLLPVNGTISSFTKTSYNTVEYTGPSYNIQWQNAMQWVRDETSNDSVFAHWWDYGYWVQTGGERATVTDGGHGIPYWDYLIGRHVLTGQSEIEALEFLNAHNVTHFLIIKDEIGKYPAYSSIGSDVDYDRLSSISTFSLSPSQTQKTRNGTNYVYVGSSGLDEDFIYGDKVYPKHKTFVAGFIVPIVMEGEEARINRPTAVLFYNQKQVNVPLNCIYLNDQKINFADDGLGGCFRVIPSISGNQQNILGAGLYVSERGVSALWTKLFLFDEEFDNFELAYDDSDSSPLALYNGRLIGPLKIWSISYPSDIEFKEEYLETKYPEELNKI
jgi:asparagine N-glycosylation enzyme membrane subunit Stt3